MHTDEHNITSVSGNTNSGSGSNRQQKQPLRLRTQLHFTANNNHNINIINRLQPHHHTPSYKAYFKRRFMIDRNWISGHHSLISYTTPETGVVTSLQFDHHHIV
ncbi:hypothetical protein BG003_007046, partial [Podila horticola]